MEIIVIPGKYKLITQEYGFDLVEIKIREKRDGFGANAAKTGETYEADDAIAYNVTMDYAINKIAHLLLHEQESTLGLNQFLKEYKEIVKSLTDSLK
jgi:hypothetical protein